MNARADRPSARAGAAVAVAVLALGGCGGSSSPPRSKHAVSAVPGLRAGSGGSRGSRATRSAAATAKAGPASTAGATGATGTVSVGATGTPVAGAGSSAGTGAGTGAGSAQAAKVTFAAPGGESRAQFVGSADSICRSFRAHARAIGAAATTLAAQETELKHLVTATEQSVKALTDLSPPTADAPGLRRFAEMTVGSVIAFADAQSRTSSTSEAAGSAVEAKDLAYSSRSSQDASAAQAAARRLGLHVCGSPGSAWL